MAKTITYTDITTPSGETATAIAGGTLDADTTYYYTFIGIMYAGGVSYTWLGKSKASQEVSATTTSTNKSIEIVFDMPEGEVGGYRIWRSTTSGGYLPTTTVQRCMAYYPADSAVNVGGTVTLLDDGSYSYAGGGNTFLEIDNDPHGIMTISGSAEDDKFSIVDLYDESEAQGWGIVEKLDVNSYKVNCYLIISGLNYWYDVYKTIIFADGLTGGGGNNAEFGTISGNLTKWGCKIIMSSAWLITSAWGTLNAYRTSFNYVYPVGYTGLGLCAGIFSSGILQDCTCDKFRSFQPTGNLDCTFKNFIFSRFDTGFASYAANFDNVRLLSGSRCFQFGGSTINVVARGVYIEGAWVILVINGQTGSSLTLIDSDISNATGIMFGNYAGNDGFEFFDKFSYNLTVYDNDSTTVIEGAVVTLYDNTEEIFSVPTDSQGQISEQFVTREYGTVHQDGGTVYTYTDKSPFKITISKAGYQTYEENFPVLTSVAIVKTVALSPPTVTKFFDGTVLYAGSQIY